MPPARPRPLGLATGTAVLAGAWTYSDDRGVIEYGEYVAPPEHVVTYDYDVPTESVQHDRQPRPRHQRTASA